MNLNPCHEEAVRIVRRTGNPVFPCRGKIPLTSHGFHDASISMATIDGWWWRWPDANVAMPVPAGVLVLDVDVDLHHGINGETSLEALEAGHQQLPGTMTVATPRGGRHLWFKAAGDLRQTAGELGDGLDTRTAGRGYVLLPPSRTDQGEYRYMNNAPIAPAPAWLKDLLRPVERRVQHLRILTGGRGYGKAALEGELDRVINAPIGTRNNSLHLAAWRLGQLVAGGVLDAATVARSLLEAAASAGLGEHESELTITSGMRAGMAQPRGMSA